MPHLVDAGKASPSGDAFIIMPATFSYWSLLDVVSISIGSRAVPSRVDRPCGLFLEPVGLVTDDCVTFDVHFVDRHSRWNLVPSYQGWTVVCPEGTTDLFTVYFGKFFPWEHTGYFFS